MPKSFGDAFEDMTIDFIDGCEDTMRATAISTWSAIITSSPVDQGRFRANWFATGKTPSVKVTNKADKSGDSTIQAAQAQVLGVRSWSEFNLTNNLPYAPVIEYGLYGEGPSTSGGYSTQAPGGVVRPNIARIKSNFEKIAKENLPK